MLSKFEVNNLEVSNTGAISTLNINDQFTFPTADGSLGQVLQTDGAGNVSWGSLATETSHTDVVVDGDFTSTGLMKRGASSGTYSIVTDNSANWNTAYSWGDHGTVGYLTSHPTISAASSSNNSGRTYIQDIILDSNGHVTGITTATETVVDTDTNYYLNGITKSGNTLTFSVNGTTNQTYTFGSNAFTSYTDHSTQGYIADADFTSSGLMKRSSLGVYTSIADNSTNWNTAYGWGDHASAGYLTSYTDTNYYLDGITKSGNTLTFSVNGTTNQNYTFGSNAFTSYTDHSTQGYLTDITSESLGDLSDVSINTPAHNQVLAYSAAGSGGWINKTFDISLIQKGGVPLGGYSNTQMGYYYSWNVGTEAVVNEQGNDIDFRVEGNTDSDLLLVDAGNDRVQIGKLNINNAFTFPTADGSAGQSLVTDGAGNVAWSGVSGGGGSTSLGTLSVTSSQSVFNTTDIYPSGGLAVFLNGVKLVEGTDFEETSNTSFTLTSPAASGDIVEYIAYGSTIASTNLQKTGDTMTGNLTVNADLIVKGYKETHIDNGNTGTSQTIAITNSTLQTYTLNDNCTFTMPTADAGRSFTIFLKTGTGSFTATFTGVKWPAGTAPTITTTASRMDILTFYSDGTNWYGNIVQEYTP